MQKLREMGKLKLAERAITLLGAILFSVDISLGVIRILFRYDAVVFTAIIAVLVFLQWANIERRFNLNWKVVLAKTLSLIGVALITIRPYLEWSPFLVLAGVVIIAIGVTLLEYQRIPPKE